MCNFTCDLSYGDTVRTLWSVLEAEGRERLRRSITPVEECGELASSRLVRLRHHQRKISETVICCHSRSSMCLRLTSQGLLGNYTDARNDLEHAAMDIRVSTTSTLELDCDNARCLNLL